MPVDVGGAAAADVASLVLQPGAAGMDLGNEVGLVGFFCVTWGRRMGWKRKAENGAHNSVSSRSRERAWRGARSLEEAVAYLN